MSTDKRRMKAAEDVELGEFFVDYVIPGVREYAAKHGTRHGEFAHVEFSASRFFERSLDLAGSHVRALQTCQRLRFMVILRHALSGSAAERAGGRRSTLWSVNMVKAYERREVREAWDAVSADNEETVRRRRRRQRTEDRLTRGMSDETSGTWVRNHHAHEHELDHDHAGRTGPHTHAERDGPPIWVHRFHTHSTVEEHAHDGETGRHFHPDDRTVSWQGPRGEHEHVNTMRHPHGGREGDHRHDGDQVVWVEWRHHTHGAEAAAPADDRNGARDLGVRRVVDREVEGDKHPAVVVKPEKDQRYRDLLDIIQELETANLALTSRNEALEEELRRRGDPSVDEADAVRQRYGKVK